MKKKPPEDDMSYKGKPIAHGPTPEQMFDCENNVEPDRTIAERIAGAYDIMDTHPIVDLISHAIEDAREIGAKKADFVAGRQETEYDPIVGLEKFRNYIMVLREAILVLEAQLVAEGEHTAAANANIDRLNTEIERVTRRQQGPLMGKG